MPPQEDPDRWSSSPFPTGHARLALFGRHRRYGPTELAHLELARQRDVPVPEVFGYAERRLWGLMVPNTAVMMEDLGDRRSVGDVLRGTSTDTEVTAALATAADLILRLHAAGCNHIDLNSGNLLLSRAGEDRGRVIDLMYARFHPAPSLNILCFMVAYFAGSVASVLPAARLEAWIAEVLSRSGAATELGQWRRLATNPQECRMSRRDRLALV